MSGLRESQLIERGLTLPEALLPAAGYIPFKRSGNTLYIAGQVPRRGGKTAFIGTLGKNMSLEDAQKAALLCSLNILSEIKAAVGDYLDHVSSVIRLVGYVA